MTATVDVLDTEFAGAMKVRIVEVDVTSYTASGEPFTPSDAGMHRFQFVAAQSDENGYYFTYDYTNEVIKAYEASTDGSALDEAGGTTDVGVVRLMCLGR